MPYVNVLIDDEKYAAIKAEAKAKGMPVYRFLPMIIEGYAQSLLDFAADLAEEDVSDPFDFGDFAVNGGKLSKNPPK